MNRNTARNLLQTQITKIFNVYDFFQVFKYYFKLLYKKALVCISLVQYFKKLTDTVFRLFL